MVRKDFTMSAVPKGRTRWSLMSNEKFGTSRSGYLRKKSCGFILIFGWRSALPSVLWPPQFLLIKRSNLPSLGVLPPAKQSIAELFSLQPASKQTSWALQYCFPGSVPGGLKGFWLFREPIVHQNPPPFPQASCAFLPPPHTPVMLQNILIRVKST